ncbi:MAG: Ribosomal protein S12 methylthiotransferase RimO [Anaerolineae bacterium]|nr:Ribosomal protein S12 methylthiotransferase RimO [Anaerolineae bacterium]
MSENWINLGTRPIKKLRPAEFPDISAMMKEPTQAARGEGHVDVLLVNPPAPDGGIWIRSQHRVGRRSRENMIWPQVELATMAACLSPDYKVDVVDAIAMRMGWEEFEKILNEKRPKYYLTQVTAPTLTNDMMGVFFAKAKGATTIAFGTHVTPNTVNTMQSYPALDFVLRGEPELTLRELIDALESKTGQNDHMEYLLNKTDPARQPMTPELLAQGDFSRISGLAWRQRGEIKINHDRGFIPDLNELPLPMHHLLPLNEYRLPLIKGPYAFVVPSRGCPAGCKYCIKHVSYNYSVRVRTAENIMAELWSLKNLGINNVMLYADLFTVNRDQVMSLCQAMIDENINMKWMCNSRVDYVDEEMLQMMGKAGCHMISWGIESGSNEILKRARKGADPGKAEQALTWAKNAGIKNFGYFIIGLPGETEETIRQTIDFSKKLPLNVAIFHIAAPYPGTPFFYEVVENGWFRPGTNWEQVDMDQSTVLDYENLSAEQLNYWQKRATREWALRPAPIWTIIKGLNTWAGFKSAVSAGLQTLSFIRS